MKQILSDFYKSQISTIVRYGVIAVICIAAFFLTGIFSSEKTFVPGIIVSAFILLTFLYMLLEIFVLSPKAFKKLLSELPKSNAEKIFEEYPTAKVIGDRHFLSESVVFYSYRRIAFAYYADLKSMKLKQRNLFLLLSDGRTLLMQFGSNEAPEIIMAYLKDKKPDIITESIS